MAKGPIATMTRERIVVMAALTALAALSWFYLVCVAAGTAGSHSMTGHAGMHHVDHAGASAGQFVAAVMMWSIMMVAMMLPTAMPAITIYGNLAQRRTAGTGIAVSFFAAGYVAVWFGYASAAATAQLALSQAALLSPMARSTSIALSSLILLAAGLFQFTAIKDACLTSCRSPLAFFLAEWRDGKVGALWLGLRHGAYCVGCCWALMAVMFVVGAMNIAWMAVLAGLMLGEKLAPARWKLGRAAGIALVLWGTFTATSLLH